MGQYKFWFSFSVQIGFLIEIDKFSFDINLPFINFSYGLPKEAKGLYFFGKTF